MQQEAGSRSGEVREDSESFLCELDSFEDHYKGHGVSSLIFKHLTR